MFSYMNQYQKCVVFFSHRFIYRENPTLHEYISPNMSRRPIRGRVTMSPELKEFYRDLNEEEMDSLLGKSHTQEWVLRENHNNNAREAAYSTHSSHVKSSRQRRGSGQSTASVVTGRGPVIGHFFCTSMYRVYCLRIDMCHVYESGGWFPLFAPHHAYISRVGYMT